MNVKLIRMLTAPYFTYIPEAMDARIELVCSRDSNPGPHNVDISQEADQLYNQCLALTKVIEHG